MFLCQDSVVEHKYILTKTSPLSQLLSIGHLDQWNLVLSTQGNDELLVGLLFAGLVEDAHVCLAAVEGLGGFAQTAGKAVVDQGDLEDSLEGVQDGHAAGLGRGIGGDFDLLGGGDFLGLLFSVRLGWEC